MMKSFIKVFMTTSITKQVLEENTQFLEKKLVVHMDLLGIMLISGLLKDLIIKKIFVTSKQILIRVGMGMLDPFIKTICHIKMFPMIKKFQVITYTNLT